MSESKHQRKLIDKYKSEGWLVLRLRDTPTSISQTGTPDLLVMKMNNLGFAEVKFIEVKSATGKLSKLQEFHISKLEEMGFEVEVNFEP